MGAQAGSEGPRRGRAGKHRRTGQALIERRDHTAARPQRRLSLPSPSPSALVGIAVLVLIAVGAIHLSGSGTAVPLETGPAAEVQIDEAEEEPEEEPEEESELPAAPESPTAAAQEATELVVHVSGAVEAPGVVHLPAGSRVHDALDAVGGISSEADLSVVNLARPVEDGEHIHVPAPGGAPMTPAPQDPTSEQPAASGAGGTIDLNTASATELEELPGVGPSIAQRIIEHREKNGPFTAVDGLLEVSGIGPATLEKIRERASV
ncbi:ComEA family DNA-binding protein [Brachybacterium sp. Z12]|uniref:ComEA family DNA-binding protein n=1 Tax=Brachybacterium sp. Z12 TaxID=2759167 RepID=UPI00185FB1AD|nr:ComEA family DNA-binding protein [Brachybacterium sp. Z12]QNN81665.1 ComEA family DNA-binding protein [Brachybacterium sp. Z12]